MRSIFFTLLAVLIFTSLASATIPNDCESSTVSYFKFDGTRLDSYGSLTVDGIISYTTNDFKVGKALNFSVPEAILLNDPQLYLDFSQTTGFTIEFWLQVDESGVSGPIITNEPSYNISMSGGYLSVNLKRSSGIVNVNKALSVNTPTFVSMTWNGSTLNLSFDGVQVATKTVTPGQINNVGPITKIGGGAFNSTIDELAFYNKALSPTTIKKHYDLSKVGNNYCSSSGGGSSSIQSDFTIAGCKVTDINGAELDIPSGKCSRDGHYYCDQGDIPLNTLLDEKGCSLGQSTYVPGSERCCPTGYICDAGTLKCDLGGVECGTYQDQTNCGNAGCYYILQDQSCVASPTEYSCSIYDSSNSCRQDTYNVGSQGVGTEVCLQGTGYITLTSGGEYIVPKSSCKCTWSANECKLEWKFTEALYSGTPNSYSCQKSFEIGACIAGNQELNWTASQTNKTGSFLTLGIPLDALSKPGCTDGETERSCGQPIIKMPGFSLISLITILGVLGLFYLFRKD
ncbi:MAG: LamG domain-containing protein [archaeon]|nr:LamG domain-containing protein [archaeon]MCR4323687.1 LamG domain-containing protein [Nanoarchaeota archaeon]